MDGIIVFSTAGVVGVICIYIMYVRACACGGDEAVAVVHDNFFFLLVLFRFFPFLLPPSSFSSEQLA